MNEAVDVAAAEGRKYVRVWVAPRDLDAVKRWSDREGMRALKVKYGNSGDVQISISNSKK